MDHSPAYSTGQSIWPQYLWLRFRPAAMAFLLSLTFLATVGGGTAAAQGPAQPEAMQFEPVDVTDVVNLATGDFVYTIPLLEVPGPEGGYPIAMSYHSGIGPNQPSTWVGLGWTLNPGAINRIVNGYPDEYSGAPVYTTYDASGDLQRSLSFGVNYALGWGSVGLDMTLDLNSGMLGVNASVALSVIPDEAGLSKLFESGRQSVSYPTLGLSAGTSGFNAEAGVGAFGFTENRNGSVQARVSVGTNGIGGNVSAGKRLGSAGLNFSGHGVSARANVNVGAGNSVGFNLNSHGMGTTFNTSAGAANFSTTQAGNGGVETSGFSIPIPTPTKFYFTIGFSQQQWVLRERIDEDSYGYVNQANYHAATSQNSKYERHIQGNRLYPAQDEYRVSAQGLSGSFKPFVRNAYRLFDDEGDDEKGQLVKAIGTDTIEPASVVYRFLGDQGGNLVDTSSSVFGWGDAYKQVKESGEEWYGSRIVIPDTADGRLRGFSVIDASGKRYEFKQPVNQIFKYTKTEDTDPDGVGFTNTNTLSEVYPTQWLLTSILGPDYVDRDEDGNPGIDDWGYWVKFKYEPEEIPQLWRAPYEGESPDPNDADVKSYSYGFRDAVYLTSIETATHEAVFDASRSKDRNTPVGRDWLVRPESKSSTWGGGYGTSDPRPDRHTFAYRGDYEAFIEDLEPDTEILGLSWSSGGPPTRYSVRKTKENVTINYENGFTRITVADESRFESPLNATLLQSNLIPPTDYYDGRKLDRITLYKKGSVESTKSVDFDYDYSLRPMSPGSQATVTEGAEGGALTLKSVHFMGQVDVSTGTQAIVTPPYTFVYANSDNPGSGLNPAWNLEDWDRWGSYRDPDNGDDRGEGRHGTPQDSARAAKVAAWSLTQIRTPLGGKIDIQYESDDYYRAQQKLDPLHADAFAVNRNALLAGGAGLKSTFEIFTGEPDTVHIDIGHTVYIIEKDSSYSEFGEGQTCFDDTDIAFTIYERIVTSTQFSDNNLSIGLEDPVNVSVDFETGTPPDEDESTCPGYESHTYEYSIVDNPKFVYGGGSRVRSVTTSDGLDTLRTEYEYRQDDGVSTGVAASLPNPHREWKGFYKELFRFQDKDDAFINNDVFVGDANNYGIPSPSVVYSKVEVLNVDPNGRSIGGKTDFEYYTALDYPYKIECRGGTVGEPEVSCRNIDKSGIYGKPKQTTYFEAVQADDSTIYRPVKIEKPLYAFSDSLSEYGSVHHRGIGEAYHIPEAPLGLVQEKYESSIEPGGGLRRIDRQYPSLFATGSSSVEYAYSDETSTPSGILMSKSKVFRWDAMTGSSIASAVQNSDGSATVTETTPAYWVYSQMMNRNQLTQTAEEKAYRIDDLDVTSIESVDAANGYAFSNQDVIASTFTTWSNQFDLDGGGVSSDESEVWRKNDTYRFIPGTAYQPLPSSWINHTGDSYLAASENLPWEMTSNVTRYDIYSRPVETVSEDGTYDAVLYGYERAALVKAVVSDARRSNFAYLDFEGPTLPSSEATPARVNPGSDIGGGFVFYHGPEGSGHTGEHATKAPDDDDGNSFTFDLEGDRAYRVSFWAKSGGAPVTERPRLELSVGGGPVTVVEQATDAGDAWVYTEGLFVPASPSKPQQLTVNLTISAGPSSSGSGGHHWVDQIRIYPEEARMQTFTYHPLTWKVTSITDDNGITSYFEYDKAGRLIATYDQDRHLRSRHGYGMAYFVMDTSRPMLGESVQFDPSKSVGEVAEYRWSVNGVQVGTSNGAYSYSFTTSGPNTVTLELIGDRGNSIGRTERMIVVQGPVSITSIDCYEAGTTAGQTDYRCVVNTDGGSGQFEYDFDIGSESGGPYVDSNSVLVPCENSLTVTVRDKLNGDTDTSGLGNVGDCPDTCTDCL